MLGIKAGITGITMMVLMALGLSVSPPPIDAVAITIGIVGVVCSGAIMSIAGVRGGLMEARERKAGYTTTFGRAFEYWQLEPDTGDVLRRPEEEGS